MIKQQGKDTVHHRSSTTLPISLNPLLEVLPYPAFFQDSAGIYRWCNPAFNKQFIGDQDIAFIGKSLDDLEGKIPGDWVRILSNHAETVPDNDPGQDQEFKCQCGDGKTRTFTVQKTTIIGKNGDVAGIAGVMLDNTPKPGSGPDMDQDEPENGSAALTAPLPSGTDRLSLEIEKRRKAEKALRDSEARYRSIFENNGTATVLLERDMTITMANVMAEKMAGVPRTDFIGRPNSLDFITAEHRDRIMLYHELRIKGDPNAPQQFEFQVLDKQGAVRDILANVQWMPDTGQTVASLLDITEKNQLQRERIRLAAVIDQSAEAIIITDKHGNVEYVNQAFDTLSGFRQKECINQTIDADFFGKEDRQTLKEMTFMVSGEDSWSGRVGNKRRDGQHYIADTRIFPICDDRGNVINLVCIKKDVTHEVQLEKQLQHAQKMEAIGTLAGGIAHDFNNILGGILGYTEISMLKVGSDSRLKQNLDRILDGCHRAKELVENILTFSRKSEDELKPIEIQVIVKEALKLLRASIPSTIEFKQQIGSTPSIVRATPTQVHQVIMNLCTNASHAMHKEGGELTVTLENVELSSEQCKDKANLTPGAYCRMAVSDTGDGMDTETQDHIFEPYFTTKEQTGGTGLGLSVVHGIVKSFGGAIIVNSQKGQGATFEIFMPRIEDSTATDAPEKVSLPSGEERILVADDELFILEIMTDMLGTLGYSVETANGGPEALDKFSEAPDQYDLVIADLTMPKLTGTQLALKIKELRKDIPIILTTGMSFDAAIEQDQFKAFSAVLNKPILYQELAQTLRKTLDQAGQV